ncbi:MAG: acyl-CoA dehydratase activase [Patescibacteria group bacterium]|nr:acyl-CoA dehydratase activase [Patescibacteria group bacterium]
MIEQSDGGPLFAGLDIGSVNARVALVDKSGQPIYLDCERIQEGPVAATKALWERVQTYVSLDRIVSAGVTGSGRRIYEDQEGWQIFSSPYAAIVGVLLDHPNPKTIVEVGGQTSLVIGLEDRLNKPWRVARSSLCAAGTGRFLEQQASRLGISIEEFGSKALEWTEDPPRIAARCSVFAKSDLIHLQQKGTPIPAMLAGLSDSVARMVRAQWKGTFESPVILIGGVAGNQGVVRAFSGVLGEQVIVPSQHASRGAIGAALLARNESCSPKEFSPLRQSNNELTYVPCQLKPEILPDGWKPIELGPEIREVGLGVDVGSTSTKAAVITPGGEVLAKTYLMTAGQPLEAIKQVMANLVPMVEGRVMVKAVGVTGSGRYLVGNFIGADLIRDEITAQTRAALNIDPQVNTIFEMGGQDSKYVYLENGVVLEYQMNKACAAGTGSFIDELSEQLGVSTRNGEFARKAFDAEEQLDLGEKCAAFMSQAVTAAQHAGASLEKIVSSLSISLAKNYRSKVVGMRRVGNHIVLTGAVFYNEAAVSAFRAEYPDKTFVVPVHKEVTGAIGAALLALEEQPADKLSQFKGFSQLAEASYKLTNFTCHHCENLCVISMMTTEGGHRLYYGSRCDRYDATGIHLKQGKVRTHYTRRNELLFGNFEKKEEHAQTRN